MVTVPPPQPTCACPLIDRALRGLGPPHQGPEAACGAVPTASCGSSWACLQSWRSWDPCGTCEHLGGAFAPQHQHHGQGQDETRAGAPLPQVTVTAERLQSVTQRGLAARLAEAEVFAVLLQRSCRHAVSAFPSQPHTEGAGN